MSRPAVRKREGSTVTSQTKEHDDGAVIADGVDEEPVESNRRLYEGRTYLLVSLVATVYAAFHMAALNGLSISELTGGAVVLDVGTDNPVLVVAAAGVLGLIRSAKRLNSGAEAASRRNGKD